MFTKIVHLDPYFATGELTVQPVVLWSRGKAYREAITKYASVGADYFKTVTPIPGHSIVYVIALGAWEAWGENKNGDGFPEFPYKETEKPAWIAQEDVLTNWYKTFEEFGYNYRSHVNKDPAKAVGKVMKAFWNPGMHRVELLIDLENSKAPDLVERIEAGEFPPVSMGTRVSYDVCNICGNRAPTRAQYCDHLKFQMRAVLADGRKVCALNPSPKFFDISWVFKPADSTAYMLKKVAEAAYELSGAAAGEYLDKIESRKTAAAKLAVMDKVIQGYPVDAKSSGMDPVELANLRKMRDAFLTAGDNTPDFPDDLLRNIADKPLPNVFSSLFSSGMMLNTPEVIKIVIYKSSPKLQPDESHLDKCVALQGSVLELFQEFPQLLDQLTGNVFDISPNKVDPGILELVEPYLEKRSGISEYLQRRFVPSKLKNENMGGLMMPLTITDPVSGQKYQTTREAAIRAHDEIAKRNLYKILGGALLLGGAYKLIGSGLLRGEAAKFRPLMAVPLGVLGASQWPSMGPHYMTDQGIPIPTSTELAYSKNAASWEIPVLGTLATMALLSHDYTSRLKRGIPMGHPALPFSRRILDKVEQTTYEHPLATALAGPILLSAVGRSKPGMYLKSKWPVLKDMYGDAKQVLKDITGGMKLSSWLCPDAEPTLGTVTLPNIDVDKVAEKLGALIVEG